jgi:hypothetical protein
MARPKHAVFEEITVFFGLLHCPANGLRLSAIEAYHIGPEQE